MDHPSPQLSAEQSKTLLILGYLYVRMGHYERAKRIFSALAALNPDDAWARRNLAALAVQEGDGASALRHLQVVFAQGPLTTRDTALYVLQAQALWLEGRKDEARHALDEFVHKAGERA